MSKKNAYPLQITKIPRLWVPLAIIYFCFKNRLVRMLLAMCVIKALTPGDLRRDNTDVDFHKTMALSKMCSQTLTSHINEMVELGWAGYNIKTKSYYIRSWDYILGTLGPEWGDQKKQAPLYFKSYNRFRSWCIGTLISEDILNHKYYCKKLHPKVKSECRERIKRVKRTKVHLKSGDIVFVQDSSTPFSLPVPVYFGMSNSKIAKDYNYSLSRASALKNESEKDGHIETRTSLLVLKQFVGKTDKGYAAHFKSAGDDIGSRGRFVSYRNESGGTANLFCLQLHDEIIPKVSIRRTA